MPSLFYWREWKREEHAQQKSFGSVRPLHPASGQKTALLLLWVESALFSNTNTVAPLAEEESFCIQKHRITEKNTKV